MEEIYHRSMDGKGMKGMKGMDEVGRWNEGSPNVSGLIH